MNATLTLTLLLLLHAPDGSEIGINPATVTSLRPRGDAPAKRLFPHAAHCLVGLTDGKAAAVIETCVQVRALMEAP